MGTDYASLAASSPGRVGIMAQVDFIVHEKKSKKRLTTWKGCAIVSILPAFKRAGNNETMKIPTYERALEYAESKGLTVNPFKNCSTEPGFGVISLPLADGGQIDIWMEGEELYGEW